MTNKKQGENLFETLSKEGFSWGVLIAAFLGNLMVRIWGTKKDSVLFKVYPVQCPFCINVPTNIRIVYAVK